MMAGGYMSPGKPLRQSLLRTFDECPQQAMWVAEDGVEWSTGPQALGTAFHAVAEEMLSTLQREKEEQMATQEAVEVMYEVIARDDVPHLNTQQMEVLLQMVLNFCEHKWTPRAIVTLEERLFADVRGPDGVLRTVTGQPDVILTGGKGVAICVDYKSGQGRPPKPRNPDDPAAWTKDHGRPYLSERGHFQLDVYGLLILRTFKPIDTVVLRELHVRWGETREATLTRDEMEHVERRVGVQLMRLERSLAGELAVEPRPGTWCHHCPRRSECPVPWEERGDGGVVDDEHAVDMAQRYVIASEIRDHHTKSLKAHLDAEGRKAIPIPGGIVGWDREGTGRKFGVHKAAEA